MRLERLTLFKEQQHTPAAYVERTESRFVDHRLEAKHFDVELPRPLQVLNVETRFHYRGYAGHISIVALSRGRMT
jgi:hypothetical protein